MFLERCELASLLYPCCLASWGITRLTRMMLHGVAVDCRTRSATGELSGEFSNRGGHGEGHFVRLLKLVNEVGLPDKCAVKASALWLSASILHEGQDLDLLQLDEFCLKAQRPNTRRMLTERGGGEKRRDDDQPEKIRVPSDASAKWTTTRDATVASQEACPPCARPCETALHFPSRPQQARLSSRCAGLRGACNEHNTTRCSSSPPILRV